MRVVDDEAHVLLERAATAHIRASPDYAQLPLQQGMGDLFRHSDGCLLARYVSACMRAVMPPDG